MILSFKLWLLTAAVNALVIPESSTSNKPRTIQPTDATSITTTPPDLQNYTSIPLNNTAILHDPNCFTSFLGVFNLPLSPSFTLNITQCQAQCENANSIFLSEGSLQRCRSFNAYMLFRDNVNMGMQCVLYQRKWGKEFATNTGDLDAWERQRDDASEAKYEVRESWFYWLTGDVGDQTCGVNIVTAVGGSSSESSRLVSITGVSSMAKSLPSMTKSLTTNLVPTRTSPAIVETARTRINTSTPTATHRKLKNFKTSTTKSSSKSRFAFIKVNRF